MFIRNYREGFLKNRLFGPRISDWIGLGWNLRVCISIMISCYADAVGQRTTFWKQLLYSYWTCVSESDGKLGYMEIPGTHLSSTESIARSQPLPGLWWSVSLSPMPIRDNGMMGPPVVNWNPWPLTCPGKLKRRTCIYHSISFKKVPI